VEAVGVMIVMGIYDPVLVALSIAVAVMASYAALQWPWVAAFGRCTS